MSDSYLNVHVGMAKTGTTLLQKFFGRTRGTLQEHGILYPVAGNVNTKTNMGHHDLAAELRMPSSARYQWNALHSELRMTTCSTSLISSEVFSSSIPIIPLLHEQLESLNAVVAGLKVIIFLRAHHEAVVAMYKQSVKGGSFSHSFNVYWQRRRQFFIYGDLMSALSAAFGTNRSTCLAYPSRSRPDKLVEVFADAIGRQEIVSLFKQERSTKANVSPSWEATALLRVANEHVKDERTRFALKKEILRIDSRIPRQPTATGIDGKACQRLHEIYSFYHQDRCTLLDTYQLEMPSSSRPIEEEAVSVFAYDPVRLDGIKHEIVESQGGWTKAVKANELRNFYVNMTATSRNSVL